MGRVIGVGGGQSVWVDGAPRYIKDLRPVVRLNTRTNCKSDSDTSSNSERIIVLGPPLPARDTESLTDDAAADDDTERGDSSPCDSPADDEDEAPSIPLRRSTRNRRKRRLSCHLCDHEIRG